MNSVLQDNFSPARRQKCSQSGRISVLFSLFRKKSIPAKLYDRKRMRFSPIFGAEGDGWLSPTKNDKPKIGKRPLF